MPKQSSLGKWTKVAIAFFPLLATVIGLWLLDGLLTNPRAAETSYDAGYSYFKNGDYSEAISHFDESIKVNPANAKAYHYRGWSKEKCGDLEGASADYDEAILVNPRYSDAYNSRGVAF